LSSLSNMIADIDFLGSPEKFREGLLQKRVPRLGQTMGAMYKDAVNACLWGDFGSVSEAKNEGLPSIC